MIDIEGGAPSVSHSCAPVAARWRRPKRRSVNSFPLSGSMGRIRIGQARSRARRKRRAFGRCLAVVDPDNNPTRCPVDGHEEGTAAALICHRWQVFQVDGDGTGFIGFEGAVLWPRRCCFQGAQGLTPCRRKQRSRPEREAFGFKNSRTTASRSSSETKSVLRRATATASCAGVNVV